MVLRSRDVEIGFLGLVSQRVRPLSCCTDHESARRAGSRRDDRACPGAARVGHDCPVLSYQCAIDAGRRAVPRSPCGAVRDRSVRSSKPIIVVTAALAEGWADCVPDHEGCHGMWGSPVEPGYRKLDGLRAAMRCERLNVAVCAGGSVGIFRGRPGVGVGGRTV